MENLIIDIIALRSEYPLTGFLDLENVKTEVAGDLDFYFPMKDVEHSNVLLISGVNEKFIKAFCELIDKQIITIQPCSVLEITWYGVRILNLPIAKKPQPYKSKRWLPVLVKKGKKFPNSISTKIE